MTKQIESLATRAEPFTYAALRIVAGAMFSFHGAQKILGWYAAHPPPAFGSQIWLGGMIELVGGVLIALGLFTRAAAFLTSGTMAVAYIQFHWKFALADGQWIPTLNKGELALTFCFLFLFLAARGSGVFSLDHWRSARATSPARVIPTPSPNA